MKSVLSELNEFVEVIEANCAKDDYFHDEALTSKPVKPQAVVLPKTEEDIVKIIALANKYLVPITARGAGTGMCGAAQPVPGGIVVSFEKMNSIIEIDTKNQVCIAEPGVSLRQLEYSLGNHNLFYPVYPGELSATIGGNAATNAGGMRALRYGVTRNHILGLRAVLGTGEILKTGGKFVKSSLGYDLTQLLIGSEGTLGLFSELTLKLSPRPGLSKAILVPFKELSQVVTALPEIILSNTNPTICEYIDMLAMDAITSTYSIELGISEAIKTTAQAYLLLLIESFDDDILSISMELLSEILMDLGALEIYVLPPKSATALIEGREKAFFVAKNNGADDIVDVVVPRANMALYLERVHEIAISNSAFISGCGHVGDGNVHLSVFLSDKSLHHKVMKEILSLGIDLGGAISGEHGIGTEKLPYFLELENPVRLELLRKIKRVFDPSGILNPNHLIV